MSQPASIGRVVHFRLPDKYGQERLRPALVVQAFGACANLTVFLDGLNDARDPDDVLALQNAGLDLGQPYAKPLTDAQRKRRMKRRSFMPALPLVTAAAVGSAGEGTSPGTWRWPAFVPPKPIEGQAERAMASREDLAKAKDAFREKRDAQLTPAEGSRINDPKVTAAESAPPAG